MIEHLKINITWNKIIPFERVSFDGKILTSSNYKIYIVKFNSDFIYIGKTKQPIGDKFRQGFRAYKKKKENGVPEFAGYSGYKWIKEYMGKILDLFVFEVENKFDNEVEAIEAEIVYLIRNKTNKWPLSQNEIHFYNDEKAKEIASEIFNEITNDGQ